MAHYLILATVVEVELVYSHKMDDFSRPTFSIVDYVVFFVILSISSVISIYFACTGGKQKTVGEFLYGNRRLHVLPVSISLIASSTSAVGILGVSSEVYRFGGIVCTLVFSVIIAAPVIGVIFLPVYHAVKLSSAYEYLELRFHKVLRSVASSLFAFQMVLYMGMSLYGPAAALSQVTGLSLQIAMLASGLVCCIYTLIGGIKAVVWIDTIQELLLYIGLTIIVIWGSILCGGISNVWSIAEQGRKTNLFDFNPNPTVMYTSWTLLLGGIFFWMPDFACDQTMVQRYMAVGSLKEAFWSIILMIPIFFITYILYFLSGLVMYAWYADCDPYLKGNLEKYEQILPYFVMDTMGSVSGMPGLFVAAIYSSSLSVISSGLNSIAAVILEDIIRPISKKILKKEIEERAAANLSRVLVAGFGCLTILVAILIPRINTTLIQIARSFYGMTAGPFLGVYTLGVLFPWVATKGAAVGGFVGASLCTWTVIGSFTFEGASFPSSNLNLNGCPSNSTLDEYFNSTFNYKTKLLSNTSDPHLTTRSGGITSLYQMSYLYYSLYGFLVTVVVGLLFTLITGPNKVSDVDPRLISPIVKYLCRFVQETSVKGDEKKYSKYKIPQDEDGFSETGVKNTKL